MGGSYAGLSAAMSLGRALRKVLVIDSGQPCGFLIIDDFQRTTVDGIYAAGDNTTFLRAVAAAVAAGNKAGVSINKELIEEAF